MPQRSIPRTGSGRSITFLSIGVLCVLAAARAVAQDEDAGAPELRPPVPLTAAEIVYPEEAARDGLEASVVLRLTLDAAGHVTDAEVVEPAGHGFDEAARDAALRLRFEPARKNGEAMAARIRYAIDFHLPAPPEPEVLPAVVSEPPPPPAAGALEITVQGQRDEARALQQSAEAVNVVDTRKAQRQTADLGEVLARSQGVAVRRDGGLGSGVRFSLNGLYDDQIRFFLDGVPLELAGFPFGIANVPVNLIERVEVYRGVVPIRFGADALGGAVNLVSDRSYQPKLAASYQVGSFGTHRVTLEGRYRHEPTGLVAAASGFLDLAKNDYDVDVEVTDARGKLAAATVPRFHDAYRAYGATLEVGVVDRPWAKRLLLNALVSSYDKELQHDIVMSTPYGEVTYGETVYGVGAHYEVALRDDLELDVIANYARRSIDYLDQSPWLYDWTGKRVRERQFAGEVDNHPHDQTIWQNSATGRALTAWTIAPEHVLRASLTPTLTTRSGDERLQANPALRDPLSAQRDMFTFVSGLEYAVNMLGDRVANVLFVKDYYYRARSEEQLLGGAFRKRKSDTHTQGVGDALRVRVSPWLYLKASYEYATRLPRPDEVFGNGVLVLANLELAREISHNLNFGPRLELTQTPFGAITLDSNAFLRDSDHLIVLLGGARYLTYQNVYRARALGLENALSWVSPHSWLSLDGMFTWQDVRNVASAGTFGAFDGDRIPNRPYMFASWGARVRVPNLPGERDTLEPFYNGRYVHGFYRGWESQGIRDKKLKTDAQVTHSVGVSWTVQRDFGRLTTTFEIDNLTDAKVFDNYGVQRPGRALYLKLTAELR